MNWRVLWIISAMMSCGVRYNKQASSESEYFNNPRGNNVITVAPSQ